MLSWTFMREGNNLKTSLVERIQISLCLSFTSKTRNSLKKQFPRTSSQLDSAKFDFFAIGFQRVALFFTKFLFVELPCVGGFSCLSCSNHISIFQYDIYYILKSGHCIFRFSIQEIPYSKFPSLKLQATNQQRTR